MINHQTPKQQIERRLSASIDRLHLLLDRCQNLASIIEDLPEGAVTAANLNATASAPPNDFGSMADSDGWLQEAEEQASGSNDEAAMVAICGLLLAAEETATAVLDRDAA